MKVVHSRSEFAAVRATLPGAVGLVPTMGALHAGHGALLDTARGANDSVVATIFVNPLQFGPSEDLGRYPRSLDADLDRCAAADIDVVWVPAVSDVYATGAADVTVAPGPLGDQLEGAQRPGHFAGVLTVVAKFLNLVRPTRAYFGEKDYQQLTLIRRMAIDLDLDSEIVGVATVRAADGLALSSRNVYLSADERARALALSRALFAGAAAHRDHVVATAHAVLAEAGITPDYLELRSLALGVERAGEPARLLVAARVGTPRLIDNIGVNP